VVAACGCGLSYLLWYKGPLHVGACIFIANVPGIVSLSAYFIFAVARSRPLDLSREPTLRMYI
jgi:hypothetical protein